MSILIKVCKEPRGSEGITEQSDVIPPLQGRLAQKSPFCPLCNMLVTSCVNNIVCIVKPFCATLKFIFVHFYLSI